MMAYFAFTWFVFECKCLMGPELSSLTHCVSNIGVDKRMKALSALAATPIARVAHFSNDCLTAIYWWLIASSEEIYRKTSNIQHTK